MKYFGSLILILCLCACHSQSDQGSLTESRLEFDDSEQQSSSDFESDRKVIKTAEIRFQVKDLNSTTNEIKRISENYSGSIANMSQVNNNYEISNHITVRIPSEKLDSFLAEVEKESIFTNYKRISAQDVTEEFLDITTRLNTKKEVRNRYIEILRDKAKSVEDILNAEEKIRVIQEEIESIEGRIKYINNKAALSTININIYQEVEYVSKPNVYKKPFITKVKEGFSNGWSLIVNIVIGLINIWPIILIFIIFLIFRRKIYKLVKR